MLFPPDVSNQSINLSIYSTHLHLPLPFFFFFFFPLNCGGMWIIYIIYPRPILLYTMSIPFRQLLPLLYLFALSSSPLLHIFSFGEEEGRGGKEKIRFFSPSNLSYQGTHFYYLNGGEWWWRIEWGMSEGKPSTGKDGSTPFLDGVI